MKIRTQFIVTLLLFGFLVAAGSASAITTNQQVEKANEQKDLASSMAQGASELSYLANDYVIYRESQQLERWQNRFASFSNDAASLQPDKLEQQALVRNIQASTQRLKDVFDSVVSAAGSSPQNQGGNIDSAWLRVSWSRMAVQSQSLGSDASRLSQSLANQVNELQRTNTIVVIALIGVFIAYFLVNFLMTQRRALRGIANLQAGTAIIGSGNLDFRIDERKNDEIGELSRAFNQMTTNLKAVTASKTDLEKEIAERQQVEKALRESEQRWATTLKSIGDAVIATDAAGMITLMNPVAEEMTGWSLNEAWQNPVRGVFKIINEHSRRVVDDPVTKVIEEGMIVGLANHTMLVRKDGTEVPIDDSGAPIRDDAGKILGVVLVFRDITERKQAEEALQRYTQELEASNKELEAFSYSVSHDLRAPLRHIDGFSRILLEDYSDKPLDEHGQRFLEIVREGSQRMALLIDDLLQLSRLTRSEMHVEKVDLSEIAESIAAELESEQPERRAELSISPGMVAQGDARLLRLAIENLLANAWKFTSKRENTRIEFGIARSDSQAAYYVRDNGAGFNPAYADKLFAPFQRLHREDDFPGTGIGLATVLRIIHRHGGRVWAEGEVDKGATFYFILPQAHP